MLVLRLNRAEVILTTHTHSQVPKFGIYCFCVNQYLIILMQFGWYPLKYRG